MTFEPLAKIRPTIELRAFAKNYFAQGGTLEAWIEAGRAAEALFPKPPELDEGQAPGAADGGQLSSADVQPPSVAGQLRTAHGGQLPGAGDKPAGGKASESLPRKAAGQVPPAREPSASYIRALAKSRMETARVLLEVHKTKTTRQLWGEVRPQEFVAYTADANMCWAIGEAFGPFSEKQKGMRLREFLPNHIFRKALAIAEVNHVGH